MNASYPDVAQLPPGRLAQHRGVLPGRPGPWPGGLVSILQARLPARPDSVAQARSLASTQLGRWGLQPIADDAAQVVSELTANAVTAARRARCADVVVRLAAGPAAVRVAVANRAGRWRLVSFLLLRRLLRPRLVLLAESGRGLTIATALSQHVGWYRSRGWTIFWAELEIPGRAADRDSMPRRQVTCPGHEIQDRITAGQAAGPAGAAAWPVT